jgi:hypothetical protein
MRPESVGLVEVRDRVTQVEDTATSIEEAQPFLRATSPSPCYDTQQRRRPNILSAARSTMALWRVEKPKETVVVECIEVSGDAESGERDGGMQRAQHKPRILTWHTYLAALGLL